LAEIQALQKTAESVLIANDKYQLELSSFRKELSQHFQNHLSFIQSYVSTEGAKVQRDSETESYLKEWET